MSLVWQNVKKIKNCGIISHPVSNGLWVGEFLCKMTPSATFEEELFLSPLSIGDSLCSSFKFWELKRALKSNANAAPGFDNVQYIMLEKLPPSAKNNPSNIFEKNFIR